jgi:hypothetical protein
LFVRHACGFSDGTQSFALSVGVSDRCCQPVTRKSRLVSGSLDGPKAGVH